MKHRIPAISLLIVAVAGAVALIVRFPDLRIGGGQDAVASLDSLRALPYVQFSDTADAGRSGVVLHDEQASFPGYNLFTDQLIDMQGRYEKSVFGGHYDYCHLNSIQELTATELGAADPRFRAGNWLLGFRTVHLVLIVDPEAQRVVWSWGPGTVQFQHMPRLLAGGTILVFDNGSKKRGVFLA